jgi:protein involved in polysaccharide export with SLBB domain
LVGLLFAFHNINAQVDYENMSAAQKDKLDTLAFKRAIEISEKAAGLLEREIDPEKYILGPNDILRIAVLTGTKKPEFETVVSPEGLLLIKDVGIIDVKDKSLAEAKEIIIKKIKNVYNTDEIYITLYELKEFKVTVSGSIKKPISVSATSVDRVSEVIEKAGGLKYNASYRNIVLIRKNEEEPIYVDLIKFFLIGEESANPTVMGGDLIIIPPISENNTIEITGEVRSDGEYEYVETDSLSTLVKYAQGFLPSAKLDSVTIARMSGKGASLNLIYVDLTKWEDKIFINSSLENDIPLIPGDRVIVKRSEQWQEPYYVKILGEVVYPGKYPILSNDDRIRDLILRAGGFTDEASIEAVEFIRQQEKERKDIEMERLRKIPANEMSKAELRYYRARSNERKGLMAVDFEKIMEDPDSQDNITLVNKDSIIVPQKKDYVNIQGRVVNPGNVKYVEGATYLDYVALAGGFGFRADESETFIRKSKGEIFLASDMNYEIEPGDVILIPPEEEVSFMEVFTTSITIIAQLATIAGVIVALMNIN